MSATENDLIARLESATEGSEDLDIEIGDLLHPEEVAAGETVAIVRFTRSLDAALTLVPEGWVFPMNNGIHQAIDDGKWYWGCALAQLGIAGHGWVSVDWRTTKPPTPAIAVCIVALKARGVS